MKPLITEHIQIVNKLGIHARSASKLVALAKSFPCHAKIGLTKDGLQNGKSIMGVLKLAAQRGTIVVLQTDGENEKEAMQALKELIANRFDEPE